MNIENSKEAMETAEMLVHSISTTTIDLALNTAALTKLSRHDVWKIHSLIEWGAGWESIHLAFCLTLYSRNNDDIPFVDDILLEFATVGLDTDLE